MTSFSKRLVGLPKALLRPINVTAVVILAAYTLLWGLWVVNPFWDVLTTADLYSRMAHVAPEAFWGGLATVVGLVMGYGAIHGSIKALKVGALTGFYHWFVICVMYFWGDWHNTGGITALMLAVYCGFIYVNLKVNEPDR